MPQYDLTEFLKLSSVLNYNLSAASLNRYNRHDVYHRRQSLGSRCFERQGKKGILMDALGYLFSAYHQKRRHLGPWPCCTRCGQRRYLHAIKSG